MLNYFKRQVNWNYT